MKYMKFMKYMKYMKFNKKIDSQISIIKYVNL